MKTIEADKADMKSVSNIYKRRITIKADKSFINNKGEFTTPPLSSS